MFERREKRSQQKHQPYTRKSRTEEELLFQYKFHQYFTPTGITLEQWLEKKPLNHLKTEPEEELHWQKKHYQPERELNIFSTHLDCEKLLEKDHSMPVLARPFRDLRKFHHVFNLS